jgi:predicted ABC-type ATPase
MASGLRPNDVGAERFRAGRLLLTRRAALIEGRESFILETTLATRTLLRAIEKARSGRFSIELTYLWVADPDLCIQRIAYRVSRRSHFVPPDDVKRRHARGRELLPAYLRAVDAARIFNAEGLPALVAEKTSSGLVVHDAATWATLMRI